MVQVLQSSNDSAVQAYAAFSDIAVVLPSSTRLLSGENLSKPELTLRIYGDISQPVVIVAGGISAGRAAADSAEKRGWWREIVGPGAAIDTDRYCIIGFDFLPNAGEAARTIAPSDQAVALGYALDIVGAKQVFAFVGASYGGMVALEFAAQFPDWLNRLVVLSAADAPHPAATAIRGVQRRIIEFAQSAGRAREGVSLARQLAMINYRTPEEFSGRFASNAPAIAGDDYPVCAYLRARGDDYAMAPQRYLTLCDSIDRQNVDPAAIAANTLLIGATSDRLIPIEQLRALRDALPSATLIEISSLYGHDAFLKEEGAIACPISKFLQEPNQ